MKALHLIAYRKRISTTMTDLISQAVTIAGGGSVSVSPRCKVALDERRRVVALQSRDHHDFVHRSASARLAVAVAVGNVRYSAMGSIRAIAVLCRMLVIISLMTFGFGAPSMAVAGPPDCMAMMQAGHAATPDKAPDSGKSCPFADLCATASYFIDPAPASHFVSHDPIAVALATLDDQFGDGLTPLPPTRPPRA
jgi:hypothetical protein